ncbi:MAG: phage holin family protein [Nitrospira sp.]|nr:phage holin family protein [Nitrospira sp.]
MYITRMWFSENERMGFRACTPTGYKLVGVAGLLGFLGWVLFLLLAGVFALAGITRLVTPPTLWAFIVPIGLGAIAFVVDSYGRSMAQRRRFQCNYKPDYASWIENGVLKTYPPGREVEHSSE